MSIPTSRRAMLAGAATLSAASAVNLAAIVASRAAHVGGSDDAELIALGEEMKPHIVNFSKLGRVALQLYETWNELSGPGPMWWEAAYQHWRERSDLLQVETGYSDAFDRWDEAFKPVYGLACRALELRANTVAGIRVQAMAEVALRGDLTECGRMEGLIWTLAREAGYPAEADAAAVQS